MNLDSKRAEGFDAPAGSNGVVSATGSGAGAIVPFFQAVTHSFHISLCITPRRSLARRIAGKLAEDKGFIGKLRKLA